MTKAEIPFYFLPRLLGLGYMFFDFEVRNKKSWKGTVNDQLNKVLEYVKSFPRVTFVCKLPPPAPLVLYLMGVGWGKGRRDHFLPTLGVGVRKPLSPGDSPYFSPRIIMSRCFLLAWCFSLNSESQRNFHAHLYCQNRNISVKDAQSRQPNWKSFGLRPYS